MKRRKKLQFDPERDTKDYRKDIVTDFGITGGNLRVILELRSLLDDETYHRLRSYQDAGGNIREAARRMGITEGAIRYTLKKFKESFEELLKSWQPQEPDQ